MFLKAIDLTSALRPSLSQDENLLFVQDAVGLYEGKYKIPSYQNGHAYLTSHRVCYVAQEEPRKYSVGIDLKDCDRIEHQAGFLKSSPKVTIYPKPQKNVLDKSRTTVAGPALAGSSSPHALHSASPPPQPLDTPLRPVSATWVCSICSFSNPVPPTFDPAAANASAALQPCLACGIKPPLATVLKAAISAAANRDTVSTSPAPPLVDQSQVERGDRQKSTLEPAGTRISCPRCTFENHPYLLECEICGASLASVNPLVARNELADRSDSPAPFFGQSTIRNTEVKDCIKLSFRGGGDKVFHERLKGAMIQRKWLLQNAPPVPQPSAILTQQTPNPSLPGSSVSSPEPSRSPGVGIAGLERRGLEARRKNEVVIGGAFEDLEALMASAKQIVSLAETLARESGMTSAEGSAETNAVLSESAAALGMITTKDMLGSGAEDLYHTELSRDLAEYLTDDRKGILHREGGIMSLIDLWAIFNRARNGVELVSPADFHKAAELWDKLKLPVRLRRFKSGLLVVQRYDWNDEKTVQAIRAWMDELRHAPPSEPVMWDSRTFGRAVTAQEAAHRFKWSVGVAAEELEMAEDRGALCREEGIEGLRFWSNYIVHDEYVP